MGPRISMNGWGDTEIVGGDGMMQDRSVLAKCKTKGGLRRMAGTT